MAVVLDHANGGFFLHQQLAEKLAGLGVASVVVAGTERTVGIILEGWLFDPAVLPVPPPLRFGGTAPRARHGGGQHGPALISAAPR